MANKVFVSPGVFTSEKDLTFVAQSVGVTTLGIVGETTKGPAFDPVFITNYDDFRAIFGGLNSEKYPDTGTAKFQVPYVAKSYLEESNQLFVTRVLGFTGYDAGDAWIISAAGDSGSTSTNGQTLAVIRSRGSYSANILSHDVNESGATCTPSGLTATIDGTSGTTGVKDTFTLTANTAVGSAFIYTVSLDQTKKNYISKVLGTTPTDRTDTVLYVEDIYPTIIDSIDTSGAASGVTPTIVATDTFENYLEKFRTPNTPYVVSELRGSNVFRLFRCVSISDGDTANKDIKISIINVNFDTKTFDLIVRGFADTDGNLNVLEQFTRLDVNPASANYIGKQIGTSDGEYALRSNYIMIEMDSNCPDDAFPSGFEGVVVRDYPTGCTPALIAPYPVYNQEYEPTVRSIRKEYLGFSNITGIDASLFTMKGYMGTGDVYWTGTTKGFHMDSGATVVLKADGTQAFDVGPGAFRTDALATAEDVGYQRLTGRKFTFLPYGGADGWDVFRGQRTNTDNFVFGGTSYTASVPAFCSTSNCGPFSGLLGDSDYYAYLYGIEQYQNPETININVFASPGIDWDNQKLLVKQGIEMVEDDRADSLYIIDSPFVGDVTGLIDSSSTATDEIVGDLDGADIDSNYSATFWPWEQVNDSENGVRIYLPPTLDVVRNIAYTDNIAFPWFASAGVNRGLCNANRTRWKLTQDDRDDLYEARINPIATFSDTGVVIWGNKTLQVKSSALDRINVRRLLLQARKLISAVALRLLFEQNDEQVRQQFLDLVNPILDNIRQERGLTDFRVTVSSDPIEIDRNELKGKIYIKPTRSLEFIEVEFNITPTGASFDDI